MLNLFKKISTALFFMIISLCLLGCATTYSNRPEVKTFIQQMAVQHQFDQKKLATVFDQVKPNQKIIQTISAPHEGLPWYRYRSLFVKRERAELGAKFWHQHTAELALAEQRYGVPAPIILAIMGVETDYGHIQGNYRVIDSLSTLAFYYPQRATFFRGELEQYLLLTRENALDPLQVQGSYAGAIGQPQFMPSSYRQYAVDSNQKGFSDLRNNNDDAILSVANYFKGHGWQAGQPVAVPAKLTSHASLDLLRQEKVTRTIKQFKQLGVVPQKTIAPDQRATLLVLEGNDHPEYWLVFTNFDVIMRYNTSAHYAMAVDQLAQLIKHYF